MADQEFLASFAVDVDEQGVARLQSVLEENQGLANEVSAAFEAATKAIQQYQEAAAAANGASPSGGEESPSGGKDNGAGKELLRRLFPCEPATEKPSLEQGDDNKENVRENDEQE